MKTTCLMMAAGSGTRFGANKLFAEIDFKPVIAYSLAAFAAHSEVDEIVVVTRDSDMLYIWDTVKEFGIPKVGNVVRGGDTRAESVRSGIRSLKAAASDIILIHDAARPCVSDHDITAVIEAARQHKAAAVGVPVADTIKRVNSENIITGTVRRGGLWQVKTPQGFRFDILQNAYDNHFDPEATDDCAIIQSSGTSVRMVEGSASNIKLTSPQDLALIEMILMSRW